MNMFAKKTLSVEGASFGFCRYVEASDAEKLERSVDEASQQKVATS